MSMLNLPHAFVTIRDAGGAWVAPRHVPQVKTDDGGVGTELALAKAISDTQRQDAAGKQETLAALEGHDADVIPTEDQTSNPATYPPSLKSAKSDNSLRTAGAQHDPLPADAAKKQAIASKEINGYSNESSDSEKKISDSLKEKDLESGDYSTSNVDKNAAEEQPAEPVDPNIVDWDGPNDPENPLNWSEKKKWGTIAVLASITFLT